MSSSCLSGGGRAYRLDIDIIKSPSNSWTSNSSSTLSESKSTNSPVTISTRKTRAPRKRPNQTYNEAAAILSTAYPKIFPTKHLTKPYKFTKPHESSTFPFEPSDLLMPFRAIDGSDLILGKPKFPPKGFNLEMNSGENLSSVEVCDEYGDDFDAESLLDEEIEEGIDSILGDLRVENETIQEFSPYTCCYGYPVGLGFDIGNGMRKESKAMRDVDEGDWWRFPGVNVVDITQKIPVKNKSLLELCKGNSIKTKKGNLGSKACSSEKSISRTNGGRILKLDYDAVLDAWADRSSPFSGGGPVAECAGNDVQARAAQIDLFSEEGGGADTEAVEPRHQEKRRTRVVSKKSRHPINKVNSDQRPRLKGRVHRTPHDEQK